MASRVKWNPKALDSAKKELNRRVDRSCSFCVAELKQVVSVPAVPILRSKTSGRQYTTTPARPGAPPRKVSGRGRASIGYVTDRIKANGHIVVGATYMTILDKTGHAWLVTTIKRILPTLRKILQGGGDS